MAAVPRHHVDVSVLMPSHLEKGPILRRYLLAPTCLAGAQPIEIDLDDHIVAGQPGFASMRQLALI
jgi:hypothetical protein